MLTTTYTRSQIIRILTFLLVLLMLGFMCYKLFVSFLKVYDYSKAEAFLANKDVISAEEYYAKASRNKWLLYKDAEIEESVTQLKPVTEIKTNLLSIRKQAEETDDPSKALLGAFANYQISKKAASSKGTEYNSIFTDMTQHFEMEEYFSDAFNDYKDQLSKQLSSGIKKKTFSDDLVSSYLRIPNEFKGNTVEWQKEIRTQLEAYDNARIDTMAAEKKFTDVLNEGIRLQKYYQDLKVQPEWLLPKVDQYVIAHMEALMKTGDLAAFSKDAKTYEESKDLVVKDSKALAYITTTYAQQLSQADKLGKENKYEQAIAIYTQLSSYRNTNKQIQNIELKWAVNEPNHILQKVSPGEAFTSVINGRDQLGSLVYSAGISKGKLVLARMLSDMSMDKKEVTLDKNLNIKDIKVSPSISMSGSSVLLIEGKSASRHSRYVAYEMSGSGLRKVLDFEADGYKIDSPGTMIVDNATGSGTGQLSFYEYRNGSYSFAGIKPDYVEISLKNLRNYKNKKVKFTCTILVADGSTAVVLYNNDYILLTGKSGLKPGSATVIGTWVGNDVIKKGAQNITAYKVSVFSISQ